MKEILFADWTNFAIAKESRQTEGSKRCCTM
jgi:hypothetical protein